MIVLIRHADTEWLDPITNSLRRDPPLSTLGRQQATQLRRHLKSLRPHPDLLVVSPLKRVQETYRGLEIRAAPVEASWLREIDYPDWRNFEPAHVFASLESHSTAAVEQRLRGLEGGEADSTYHRAVVNGLFAFLRSVGLVRQQTDSPLWKWTEPEKSIWMIGHIGSISTIISTLLGTIPAPWERQRYGIPVASTTCLESVQVGDSIGFSLTSLGCVTYLADDVRPSG